MRSSRTWSTWSSSCSRNAPSCREPWASQTLKFDSASLKTRKPRSWPLRPFALLVVQLGDDAADALLGDVGDGRVVVAAGGLGKLHEDELAVAAVLRIEIEDGVGDGARAREEVDHDGIRANAGGTHQILQEPDGLAGSRRGRPRRRALPPPPIQLRCYAAGSSSRSLRAFAFSFSSWRA